MTNAASINSSTLNLTTLNIPMRRVISVVLSAACLVVLLTVIQLSKTTFLKPKQDLVVRQVSVALPPPPPPPAQEQQQVNNSGVDIDFSFNAQGLALKMAEQNVKIREIKVEKPPIDSLTQVNLNIDWTPDWQAFGLDQLDQRPQLLTPIRVSFPHRLYQRGVNKALVKLLVMIDEQGQVHLQQITQLKYPELKPSLQQAISQARFTPPKMDGKLVKAEFIWPLELEHS
ncbi:hypothetical protein [uncultured Pseudoteredinibacter sp.]|uniref:hypothetical protein n=1 Tax=uncultured Pseudoteredinibacter sp. TaxID=1641701 RepID=UPI00261F42DD|nr:hypothetical protein [uncultured Pseudoteredinibacter sp.]